MLAAKTGRYTTSQLPEVLLVETGKPVDCGDGRSWMEFFPGPDLLALISDYPIIRHLEHAAVVGDPVWHVLRDADGQAEGLLVLWENAVSASPAEIRQALMDRSGRDLDLLLESRSAVYIPLLRKAEPSIPALDRILAPRGLNAVAVTGTGRGFRELQIELEPALLWKMAA